MGRTLAIVPAAGSVEQAGGRDAQGFVDLAGQTHIDRALAGLRASGSNAAVVTGGADRSESTPLDPTPAEVVLGVQ